MQRELAEPMKQIAAESALRNGAFQIAIRRRHNTHVHRNFSDSAETVIRRTIQHAQQFYLQAAVEFADFIQEDGSLMGQFKQPRLGRIGSAERAPLVVEQSLSRSCSGNAAQLKSTQGCWRAPNSCGPREPPFLAHAALPVISVVALTCHALDHLHQPLHGFTER